MFRKRVKEKEKAADRGPAMPGLHDLYLPDRIKEYEDYLRIDDMYCRVLVVDALPENVHFGWFNSISVIGGVTISVTLVPYGYNESSDRANNRLVDLGAELMFEAKRDNQKRIGSLQEKHDFYELLLKEINMKRNKLIAATVTILVYARSYRELCEKCQLVKDKLGPTRAITLYKRQLPGFKHILPYINTLPEYHDVTVANAACLSPLVGTDFTHPSGVFFGENRTGAPVFLDLFIGEPWLFGPHMFITGTTRSGKSYTCKGIVAREVAQGYKFVILDYEGEYEKVVEALGGVRIKLHPAMQCMFNPFDIRPEYEKDVGWFINIPAKVDDIVQLIAAVLEAQTREILGAEERALAGLAVRQEYEERGITSDPESIYLPGGRKTDQGYIAGKSVKEMPTISSYVDRLRKLGLNRLANILLPFCRGGPQGFFDGQTRVDTYQYPIVWFDLSRLSNEFSRMYGMYVMLSWVWEQFVKKSRTQRKCVLVDEAWILMRHADTAKFMSDLARRGAKYNTSLIAASQSFREFTTQEGMAFLAQCDTKFFLRMQRVDAVALNQMFDVPMEVINSMDGFKVGEGLLRAGKESAIVQFRGFPFEDEFLRSDPEATMAR